MAHPSKAKGNGFERQIVREAIDCGLSAKRAYASNGESLGCSADVDCIVAGEKIQAKRRKTIASYLRIPAGADAVVFREDRGTTLALIRWSDFLKMLKRIEELEFACGDDL